MVLTLAQVRRTFGAFAYREAARGRIVPDPDWVAGHIVAVELPLLGGMRCHRLVAEQLRAIWREIAEHPANLRDLIDIADTRRHGGCYVPRHMGWDPRRGLSHHSWGIAIDVNPTQYSYGSSRRWDPRIIRIFAGHGFVCGQDWRTPDPMHFEAIRSHREERGT
jgi:hypothetical protein